MSPGPACEARDCGVGLWAGGFACLHACVCVRGARLSVLQECVQCLSSHREQIRSECKPGGCPCLEGFAQAQPLSLFLLLFVAVQGCALGRPGFPGGPTHSGKPWNVACCVQCGQGSVWLAERTCPKDRVLMHRLPCPQPRVSSAQKSPGTRESCIFNG